MTHLLSFIEHLSLDGRLSWFLKDDRGKASHVLTWQRSSGSNQKSRWTIETIDKSDAHHFSNSTDLRHFLDKLQIDLNHFYEEIIHELLSQGAYASYFLSKLKTFLGEQLVNDTIDEMEQFKGQLDRFALCTKDRPPSLELIKGEQR